MQKEKIAKAPATPGVYIFLAKSEPIYIGKATNIKARLLGHFQAAKLDPKEKMIVSQADSLKYYQTDSDFRAILLEAKLINQYQPRHNVRGRDDKSHLYLQITTSQLLPKVLAVRRSELDNRSLYFGPFPSQKILLSLVNHLRKIIPFCTQKKISKHACFYSKIDLCSPCPNWINTIRDPINRKVQVKIYRKNIRQIVKILNGNDKKVLQHLYNLLKLRIKYEDYEEALLIRNQIYRLEYLVRQKTFHYEEPLVTNNGGQASASLQSLLVHYFPGLPKLTRLEAVDISNYGEGQIVGSLVTFIEGIPSKKDYRRFRIKSKTRSDFQRIAEVLTRRFRNPWAKPDLFIIDGGRPQVRTVYQTLARLQINLPVLGIAKGPDRLVVGPDLQTLKLPLNHPGFNLVRAIRDEAHRFAKKYHLVLRSQNYQL